MRTPSPVLPEPQEGDPLYVQTWMDRRGPDGANEAKAIVGAVFVFCVGFILTMLALLKLGIAVPGGLPVEMFLAASISAGIAYTFYRSIAAAGDVALAFVQPSGKSTPYEQQFSFQDAMIMKGDIAGALESYEAVIAEQPEAVAPRMRAAEHYVKDNRDPQRAAVLFREVRQSPQASPRDMLYASSRLVDLYDGVLADPGRALVELRRIIEQHPTSAQARHARAALPDLKMRVTQTANEQL